MNLINVYDESQQRSKDQITFHRRSIQPVLKNTFLYHEFAYGWIPETVIWNSRYEDLNLSNYYKIDLGLLNKFNFLINLYQGPPLQYTPKMNTQFINNGAFTGKFNDFFKKFNKLPTSEFISFLLLTSIPIYNILYLFKNIQFDIKKHSLCNRFYVDNDKHIELAKYLISGGDYKPIFSRLDHPGLYDGTLRTTGLTNIQVPQGVHPHNYARSIETLANLGTIIHYTRDPVLIFLIFYIPGLAVTTKITPAITKLMEMLGLQDKDVILV